ncbi:MAG TPA: MmpS family transport accessory protein [Actinopolymorphaceae bacterium]
MRRRQLIGGLWLFPVLLGFVVGCGSPETTSEPEPVPPFKRKHTVIYEVTGPGKADIHYWNDDGEVHLSKVSLPWRKKVTITGSVPLTLSAMVPGFETPAEPFTCTIVRDGKQVAKESKHLTVTCNS